MSTTPETPEPASFELVETPDYDGMVSEYGDPDPVLADLREALDQPAPVIDEAHPDGEPADEGPADEEPGTETGDADAE